METSLHQDKQATYTVIYMEPAAENIHPDQNQDDTQTKLRDEWHPFHFRITTKWNALTLYQNYRDWCCGKDIY
jgi:hypothetical protein